MKYVVSGFSRTNTSRTTADDDKGLTVSLDERRGVTWSVDVRSGNAARSKPRTTDREIEVCAQCHSRRAQIADGYEPGKPLLDHYLPALLTDPLYRVDGQQQGEVYNWGSFLQSKMHAKGVTCSDCHDPHTGKLRAEGNALCSTLSPRDQVRHHRAYTPHTRECGRVMRCLPHAAVNLHGRGSPSRSQPARAEARPVGNVRDAERVQ